MISYLQVENLTKSFGDLVLFENISFGIGEGDKVAIIAKNGTGKSTLLNIIAGKEGKDSGNVIYRNGLRVGFLEQTPQYPSELTVIEACFHSENEMVKTIAEYEKILTLSLENPEKYEQRLNDLFEQMDRLKAWDYEQQVKQILSSLKITNFSQKISELSGGQLKRVALANILISEPDLLILDEPTNHLDLEMVEWLENLLLRSKMTLLMVTHDRYFLDRVCNSIIELDQKQIYTYKGNYNYYLQKRQERIEVANAELEKANNLFRKELDWMRRMPQARATKAQARIDAFYDLKDKVTVRREKSDLSLDVKATYIGSKIFEAQYVSKSYGDLKILDNFYYNFSRYEKMGIVGKNGTGKSTFLKMLLGQVKPDSGTFDIGETVSFGYYSQEGLKFNEQMKVIDVIRDIAEEIHLGDGRKMSASQFLQHFLFAPEKQHNYVYKLSGGEKRRLYLCSVLMKSPNFLVLDEPTNDLDIVTLNLLEEYLRNFKGCVIVVSHDRYFMDKVVDHLLVFEGNAVIKDFPGNYSDYRDWKEKHVDAVEKKEKKAEQPQKAKPKDTVKKKLSFKEQQEFIQLEKDIEKLELEKKELETKMNSGELTHDKLLECSNRYQQVSDLLDEKTMRWLELSEIGN